LKRFVIVLMALTLMTSCAQNGSSEEKAGGGDNNQADVDFVMGMIPHHEQAMEMASMAEERSENSEVKALASRIQQEQEPEVEEMNGLLEEWGEDTAMDHDMSGGEGGGMLDEGQMQELESAAGAEFDRLFLEGMIGHHEGAIAAAAEELENGQSAEAKELANKIIEAQEEEISVMEDLLTKL
jgi:uncharacterized protein (DUF305 family)